MAWWNPKTWFPDVHPKQYECKPFTKPVGDIPPGSIILFSSNKFNLVSWLIRQVTHARVNHAGLYFGSGKHETIEAQPQGVKIMTLDTRINTYDMLWVYRYKKLTVDQLQGIKGYAYGSVGKRYDFIAVAEFVLGGDTDDKSTNFCSENVVLANKYESIETSMKEPNKTAPGDLQRWFESHPAEWELWDTQNVKAS